MPANFHSGDDTDSRERWDACWSALERLPRGRLATVRIHAEAARLINSCRAATEGRGIEHIEHRAYAAHQVTADRIAAGDNGQLNRFMAVLNGALSVLRSHPRHPV